MGELRVGKREGYGWEKEKGYGGERGGFGWEKGEGLWWVKWEDYGWEKGEGYRR